MTPYNGRSSFDQFVVGYTLVCVCALAEDAETQRKQYQGQDSGLLDCKMVDFFTTT